MSQTIGLKAPTNLKEVLRLHALWLNDWEIGERADLRETKLVGADLREANLVGAVLEGANLREANLVGANLRWAVLEGANLREADLREADLDYAAWPLWCGSLGAKADRRLAAQLAYHFCRIDFGDDELCKGLQEALVPLANEFHRVRENGIPPIKERGRDPSHPSKFENGHRRSRAKQNTLYILE